MIIINEEMKQNLTVSLANLLEKADNLFRSLEQNSFQRILKTHKIENVLVERQLELKKGITEVLDQLHQKDLRIDWSISPIRMDKEKLLKKIKGDTK